MKLVYIQGRPYWMTPEGRFIDVHATSTREYGELYLKTPEGIRLMGQQSHV